MSHGITAKDSMFSVRERPWHGLGVVLPRHPRSIDDALKKAGLAWPVIQRPVLDKPAGKVVQVDGYMLNIRKDTGDVLGVVTDRYTVVQNREAFEFLAALLGSDLRFETAGSLHGGKRVFVTCKLAELPHIEVGGDRVDLFANFFNSHDGGGAINTLTTPVRTVCQNTWDFAVGQAVNQFKIAHVGDPIARVDEARRALGLSLDYGKQFKQWGDRLAKQKIAERKVLDIAATLWPGEGSDRSQKSAQRRREAVVHLFLEGDTVGNAPGTKWCAANAFIEQIEWGAKTRSDEGRFLRHIGDPTSEKRKALELVADA